ERRLRLLGREPDELFLSRRFGEGAQVDEPELEPAWGGDRLQGLAVADDEEGAQRFVAADDLFEAALERALVQREGKRQADVDVVERAPRRQLIQKPQPLLRKRQHARLAVCGATGYPRNLI